MDSLGNTGSSGASGSEFLPEFKGIHNKLKKRFLRKPNVSEASEQFSKLGKKMHSRDEPQYEGLCHLAVARCERSLGNASGKSEALLVAARSFLKAELATRSIGCPSLEEHFQAAIQALLSLKPIKNFLKYFQKKLNCISVNTEYNQPLT